MVKGIEEAGEKDGAVVAETAGAEMSVEYVEVTVAEYEAEETVDDDAVDMVFVRAELRLGYMLMMLLLFSQRFRVTRGRVTLAKLMVKIDVFADEAETRLTISLKDATLFILDPCALSSAILPLTVLFGLRDRVEDTNISIFPLQQQ